MTLNRYIAKQICIAQICSDAGKGIRELSFENDKTTLYKSVESRYAGKDIAIQRAISKINSLGNKSGFHFYVTNKSGMSYYPYIIYFDFKVNGKRYQVSFHSGNDIFEKYIKKGTSHRSTWDHESSRQACQKLVDVFGF